MDKKIICAAAVLGALGIILGAFGAHALKKILEHDSLVAFETGVRYQMYHALFLLFVGTTTLVSAKAKKAILTLVLIGVIFFSGSIYLLSANVLFPVDFKPFGFITPIGGLLLITAWVILFLQIIRGRR
ncbi:MAG: DUF423 domain-containing protein [Flavobacterium sp.]|nr:MAG: DUF423 domain-containing protein [Flavobacterium sp.]